MPSAFAPATLVSTCASMERPAISCKTFGRPDFMRVPSPAARTMARALRLFAEDIGAQKPFRLNFRAAGRRPFTSYSRISKPWDARACRNFARPRGTAGEMSRPVKERRFESRSFLYRWRHAPIFSIRRFQVPKAHGRTQRRFKSGAGRVGRLDHPRQRRAGDFTGSGREPRPFSRERRGGTRSRAVQKAVFAARQRSSRAFLHPHLRTICSRYQDEAGRGRLGQRK